MLKRPPIIVVMGHVDHGKTTLLDYIRKTTVAAKEAGGITQSIGAYEISHNGKKITFIDTPGHEAFSKMRARGAQVADLAILVVAADDGVKLQTKDAISHIKKENLPFVVAINKIDKNNADVERTKKELSEAGVFLEGYGGNISWQAISAKTGQGINELLDLVLLTAELEDLKYDPAGRTQGLILAAKLDPRRGITVGAIVKNGILKTGQSIATPTASGKIRTLENFLGKKVEKLEPSAPALILGFEKLPQIGEEFFAGEDRIGVIAFVGKGILEQAAKIEPKETIPSDSIRAILKAEELGSLEVLEDLIKKISPEKPFKIIGMGVGNISENDVKLAISTQAFIIGFKVRIDKAAENLSRAQDVKIFNSPIIYELEKIIKEFLEKSGGEAKGELEILAVFGKRKGNQQIVGGRINEGVFRNKQRFEILNPSADGEKIIGTGRILNIQFEKKDVAQAEAGKEVGLLVESETEIKPGQKIIL